MHQHHLHSIFKADIHAETTHHRGTKSAVTIRGVRGCNFRGRHSGCAVTSSMARNTYDWLERSNANGDW